MPSTEVVHTFSMTSKSGGSLNQRLVVKGGTKISLHQRFTQLGHVADAVSPPSKAASAPRVHSVLNGAAGGQRRGVRAATAAPSRPAAIPVVSRQYGVRARSYHYQEEDDYDSLEEAMPGAAAASRFRFRSSYNEPYAPPTTRLPPGHWRGGGGGSAGFMADRRPLFDTALRLKKRAIMHRLGSRRENDTGGDPYSHLPYFIPRAGAGGNWRRQPRGRWRRGGGNMYRSRSSYSLNEGGGGWYGRRPRGGGAFFGRGSRGRGYWRGGGFRRGGRRGWNNNAFSSGPPPTREELDRQLDDYMKDSKTGLDKELDAYMSESK